MKILRFIGITILISFIASINVSAVGLSNRHETIPIDGDGSSREKKQEIVTQVEVAPESVVDVEAGDGEHKEIKEAEYIGNTEIIRWNLNVAQIIVIAGLICIVVGALMTFGISNPYGLPTVIMISDRQRKQFSRHIRRGQTTSKVPCQADPYRIYLLALQGGFITKDTINKLVDERGLALREKLLEATELLEKTGRIKYRMSYRGIKAYSLTSFGIQEVMDVANYLNYLVFADRNNNLKEDDSLFVQLIK